MIDRQAPELVAIILVPQFSMMPVTAAIEPLRLANRLRGKEIYRWMMVSLDGGPVRASNGVVITPDAALDAVPPDARILVCSGLEVHKYTDKGLLNWLRKRARRGAQLGAACTAAHILASAGVLDGYRCTIHWENLNAFYETFEKLQVTGNLYEIDRERFSCAGGTSALDMMLAMMGVSHGEDLASEVADQVLHAPIRSNTQNQRRSIPARIGTRHPKLRQIIERMQDHIEEPVSPALLAKEVGLSSRQIERLFKRYLQRTPKRFYLELRLHRARSLLLQTDMSVINVALSSGFSSPSHFSKCYRSFFGRTPYRERGTGGTQPPTERGDPHVAPLPEAVLPFYK